MKLIRCKKHNVDHLDTGCPVCDEEDSKSTSLACYTQTDLRRILNKIVRGGNDMWLKKTTESNQYTEGFCDGIEYAQAIIEKKLSE